MLTRKDGSKAPFFGEISDDTGDVGAVAAATSASRSIVLKMVSKPHSDEVFVETA
jgi:hypothetical protein